MIINGLTDDGEKMVLLYTSSDGTRGSQNNPYRLEDIYDTCVANNWDYIEKLGNTYLIKYQLNIGNIWINNTHFKIDDENVELINNIGATQNWYWCGNKYFNNCRITGINAYIGDYRIRIGIYGGVNNFNNIYFNGFDTISVINGIYNINNMYWNRISNSYIFSGNSVNLTIDNFLSTNCSYGFIPMTDFTYATNLGSDTCYRGILAGYASWTIHNFFAKNCTYDLAILLNGTNRYNTLINPKIDLSKTYLFNNNGLHTTTNCNGYVDIKSTFKLLIDDCDYIIKDNYGNEYSGNTSDINELDITYWYYEGERNGDDVNYQVLDQFQPFTIELKKDGYETNIINDVYITNGEPTIIRATLKKQVPLMIDNTGKVHIKTNPKNIGNNREFLI